MNLRFYEKDVVSFMKRCQKQQEEQATHTDRHTQCHIDTHGATQIDTHTEGECGDRKL